jgi:hypothetical protein
MKYESGNSALLIAYRQKLVEAYKLGEEIKFLYQIIPPTVFNEEEGSGLESTRLSLTVNKGLLNNVNIKHK